MAIPIERRSSSLRNSQMLRLVIIGVLVLVLQIPVLMISGLVRERQQSSREAVEEVSGKWGRQQTITGPALIVPYLHTFAPPASGRETPPRSEWRQAVILPETLGIDAALHAERRRRGIFSVPVYDLQLELKGTFDRPDVSALGIDEGAVAWERSLLVVGISDARAIQTEAVLLWNAQPEAFLPGTADLAEIPAGIHAPAPLAEGTESFSFSFPLALNGSTGAYFMPFGKSTAVDLTSNFADPSFQGNWLPVAHEVTSEGFEARWAIPFLGRNYPQAWLSSAEKQMSIGESRFGVDLVSTVDHYRMALRSIKYAGLFILLTFATVWLIEVLAGLDVHPIQYLLLGAALCVFYLLELSLSEHLGFPVAYVLASLLIVAMVSFHAYAMLRERRRAAVVGVGVALLYAFLYLLLLNEDYALLIGSIGLFAFLAAIMVATRNMDWYAVGARQPQL